LDASLYNALSVFTGAEESLASVPSPKQSDVDDHSCTSKNVASVGTQWEDHIFEEHFTHPHVGPNLYEVLFSSIEHKRLFILENVGNQTVDSNH
uniref:Uncharacterized protein n=1 Tax=Sinocyclocheilus anshuiensis TaxID=1608454 RepID=A0A671L727_9TELE